MAILLIYLFLMKYKKHRIASKSHGYDKRSKKTSILRNWKQKQKKYRFKNAQKTRLNFNISNKSIQNAKQQIMKQTMTHYHHLP